MNNAACPNRFLLLSFFLFSSYLLHAQIFEWGVSSSGIDLSYEYASMDKLGNIVAGGEVSIHDYRNPPELFNAKGEKLALNPENKNTLVISYSPEGNYNWHVSLGRGDCSLYGIAHDQKDQIALLVYVHEADYAPDSYYDDEEEAEIPEDSVYGFLTKFSGYEPLVAGWTLVYLNNKGQFIESIPLFPGEEPDFEMNAFLAHPQGGFILGGFTDPRNNPKILKTPIGQGGGDFVLRVSAAGKPEWMQVASYVKNTCCSWADYNNTIAVAPDGTVYLAGKYEVGAVFDGKKTMMAPAIPNGTQYNKPYETYVVSYTAAGKLNWVKTSDQRVTFEAITADPSGVYLAYKVSESDYAFGKPADTTGGKRLMIAKFDTKGSVKWVRPTSTERMKNMRTDAAGNLYALGSLSPPLKGEIGSFKLAERTRMFLAMITPANEVKWVKEARLPVWGHSSLMTLMVRDEQQVYVAGGMWSVLSSAVSIWDAAFKAGNGYGGTPFIVKWK